MDAHVKHILLELHKQLAYLYGDNLMDVILFGSRLRENAPQDSDIDILVVLKGKVDIGEEVERTGKIISDLSLKYDTLISCIFMDNLRYEKHSTPLLRNIRRNGVKV